MMAHCRGIKDIGQLCSRGRQTSLLVSQGGGDMYDSSTVSEIEISQYLCCITSLPGKKTPTVLECPINAYEDSRRSL